MKNQRHTRASSYPSDSPGLDTGILAGFGLAAGIFLLVTLVGGNFLGFLSPLSLLIVLGGTFAAVLVQFSTAELFETWRVLSDALRIRSERVADRLNQMLDLSQRVKINGVLILEDEAADTSDPFLRLGLELVSDGHKGEEIRRILEREIWASEEQGAKSAVVIESMGSYAPALGLIGTVLGLIQMLGQLNNAEALGPSLSLALVATLYASVLANLVFFPLAGKIRLMVAETRQKKLVTLEALVSIAQNESTIMLEQRLQSFSSLAA